MEASTKKKDRALQKESEDKIEQARAFLSKRGIKPHLYNLLGLVGAYYVEDFIEIDDVLLEDIKTMTQIFTAVTYQVTT